MALEELKCCCRGMNSDKITERKKAAQQLRSLLNNENLVATLCHISKVQSENTFNWNQVFQSSTVFFLKESEKLEKDQRTKENPSSTVISNWANSMRVAASIPKLVLKKSCQDVPHIRVSLITDLAFTILNRDRPYLLEHYAGDAVQIMLKYVLKYSQYYVQVPQEKWKDMMRISIWIFDHVENLDLVSVVNLIEGILIIYRESKCSSCNALSPFVALRPIASFLSRGFKKVNLKKNYGLQGALLSLLLTASLQFGAQWRFLLCNIGEECFEDVLQMWENKPTARQITLLRYINLQLIIHDPQIEGEYKEENHYSGDSNSWKRKLKQLYLIIYDNLMEFSQMCRVSSNVNIKEYIPNELVTLAARLVSQVFDQFENATSIDITQIGLSATSNSSLSQKSKRRRVEIGFPFVCDQIRQDGAHEASKPWYLIFTAMMKHHRIFFTKHERAFTLLDLLLHVFSESKKDCVSDEILRCLTELAHSDFFSTTDIKFEENKRKWTKVAELTIRLVSGKHCLSTGVKLLQVLVANHLIYFQISLYKLFIMEVLPLDENSLKLLETLLLHYPLPKTIKKDDHISSFKTTIMPRSELINILFPLELVSEIGNEEPAAFSVHYPLQVARVVALLVVQKTIKIKIQKVEKAAPIPQFVAENRDKEIEILILKSLGEYPFVTPWQMEDQELDFDVDPARTAHLPILEEVFDRIKIFISERMGQIRFDIVQKTDVQLTLDILHTLIHLWFYLKDERLLKLIPKLTVINKYIEKLLAKSSTSSSQWNELLVIMNQLKSVIKTSTKFAMSKKEHNHFLQLLYDSVPSSLQETLVRAVRDREPSIENSSLQNVSQLSLSYNSNNCRNVPLDSNFDDEFDESDSSENALISAKDEFEEESYQIDGLGVNKGSLFEFSRASLTPRDEAILSISECLAKMYEIITVADPAADEEELPFILCVKSFSKFLQSNKSEEQIMVLEIITLMFTMNYNEDNVEDGMLMLSKIAGRNSSNVGVVSHALIAIKDLLSVNGKNLIREHRSNVVHLLKTFSEKFKAGNYGLKVSELIHDCVICLIELDPLREWSHFSVNEDDRLAQVYGLMKSPYNDVRIKVVDNLSLLFEVGGKPLPLSWQRKNFEQLYQIAIESLAIEGNISREFAMDERRLRVASFLRCLVEVAANSSVLEHQAVYAIVSSIKVNNIDLDIVKKFLRCEIRLGTTLTSYMKSHVEYLVAQWIKDKHCLEEFPYQTFDVQDLVSFLRKDCSKIVSSLFTQEEGVEAVTAVSHILESDLKDIVEDNFPYLMAVILPYLIASANNHEEELKLSRKKIAQAKSKWKALENILGMELLKSHIVNDIGEITLNLFRLSHNTNVWYDGEVIVSPSHSYFETSVVLFTIKNIHSLFFKEEDSLISLLCDRKSPIYAILHGLFSDIAKALSIKSRRLRLYLAPFETFVRALFPAIGCSLQNMEYFLIRKLVYILLSFVVEHASQNVDFAVRCSSVLLDLISVCLKQESSIEILTTTLPTIIPRLYSLHSHPAVGETSCESLLLFFRADSDSLKRCLSNLPLFLDEQSDGRNDEKKVKELHDLHQNLIKLYQGNLCLRKRVERFVQTPTRDVTYYDVLNISHLLNEKYLEIDELYASFMVNGSVTAHSLIQKIVSIISNTDDEKIGHEGLKCLGKLGPVDLNSSVFFIEESIDSEIENLCDEDSKMMADILLALNRMTFSTELSLVETSGAALRQILSLRNQYMILHDMGNENLVRDLMPFIPSRKPKTRNRLFEDLSIVEFEAVIGCKTLWEPKSDLNAWLIAVAVSLINAGCGSDFFNYLVPVCQVDANFCKFVLPFIILHSLKTDLNRRSCLSKIISHLVKELSEPLSSKKHMNNEGDNMQKSCLRIIVRIISFLRKEEPPVSFSGRKRVTKWDRNFWLDVDYMTLAKAASHCDSLYSATLFSEIACDILQEPLTKDGIKDSLKICSHHRPLPPLQRIRNMPFGKDIPILLLKVSNELGDSDGVEGCSGVGTVTDSVIQSTLSLHRGRHAQALYISDAVNNYYDLVKGLHSVGMYNSIHKMSLPSCETTEKYFLEAQAECAWRLGQWEDDVVENDLNLGFNSCFLKALKSLKDKDFNAIQEIKDNFYDITLSSLRESGHESTSSIYPVLTNLQMFAELAEVSETLAIQSQDEITSKMMRIDSWWNRDENLCNREKIFQEKIISGRIASSRLLLSQLPSLTNLFENILLSLLVNKCEFGNIGERFSTLLEAKSINKTPEKTWVLGLEEAKLALALDNNSQAICALERLIEEIKDKLQTSGNEENLGVFYSALILYGNVLTKSKVRPPKYIIENCYEKAVNLIEESSDEKYSKFLNDSYQSLASFSDNLYQEVKNVLTSDTLQNRIKQMERSKCEIERMRNLQQCYISKGMSRYSADPQMKSINRSIAMLEKDVLRENEEVQSRKKEADEYMGLSLENYLKTLCCSSKYDLNIFRVVALWFENPTSTAANKQVYKHSSKMKSHKFIPLMYQLVARLSLVNDAKKQHPQFNAILSSILERVCSGHPHHGLPVVLMLAHAHLDDKVSTSSSIKSSSQKLNKNKNTTEPFIEEDRVKAAKALLETLKNKSKLKNHIAELESVFTAYVTLANMDDKDKITKMTPSNSLLMKFRNLNFTAPLTRPITIQASEEYSVPLIAKWDPSVEVLRGVNKPLKMSLYSSDGVKSIELLKGNDDLRQDAVLEQLFCVVNELLTRDEEAKRRKLRLKTYLVIPLSQKTGLIQWCENTTTLSEYLDKAQKRYYPNDYSAPRSRGILCEIFEDFKVKGANHKESKTDVLFRAFEDILAHMHPVLQYFFYEEFPQPEKWFTHRRAYTCSVATSSVVGYIFGLGDRHVQNILLDLREGEVVHIDLGIAFENGKLLPTPERVPFRMSQNIVAGFGAMGVEGPLRQNMATTMRILREAKSVLITILEVLRHDPLHHWTISPTQAMKLQERESQEIFLHDDSNSASMAERALIRVQQKLNGLEDGLVLSVPDHVNILIQQAVDIKNLSQMYFGWQAYL